MSSEYSTWWHVTYRWTERLPTYLADFTAGLHTFSPLQQIHFPKETVIMWGYIDRLMTSLIHHIIKPTLQHVISSRCMNMGGPSQVPVCIKQVEAALDKQGAATS
jgi:hypothetical protein